jgi:HD-GYP domain-containing protein (c-di-GMP phosphodiesterase class II)
MTSRRQVAHYLFVCASALVAAALLVASFLQLSEFKTIAGLCVLVLAGSALRSAHGSLNVTLDTLVLGAVYVVAGPAAAVVVAFVGSLWQRRPIPPIKKVFNSAQRVLSAAGGAFAYQALNGPVGDAVFDHVFQAVVAITGTTGAHQLVNASLMCVSIWVERGLPTVKAFLRDVVAPTVLPLFGYSYFGLMLAVVWLGGLGILAGPLVVVPLVVARWALSQDVAETNAQAATMRAFIQVIETKDLYTRGHSERVSQGVAMLGKHLGLPEDRQSALEHAGLLHDVGKVGVPTSVIRKPGKLDDSEWAAIRLHPARGVELIGGIPFLEEVKSAVLHHHEKYDGTGYPAGLSGQRIPYFARMIGIVDAFDCLTSTRSYRPAKSVDETLAILIQDRKTHFDPALVDAFVQVIRRHGWKAAEVEQPAPDASIEAAIDHDDLSLGSGGGATGSAAGPATGPTS